MASRADTWRRIDKPEATRSNPATSGNRKTIRRNPLIRMKYVSCECKLFSDLIGDMPPQTARKSISPPRQVITPSQNRTEPLMLTVLMLIVIFNFCRTSSSSKANWKLEFKQERYPPLDEASCSLFLVIEVGKVCSLLRQIKMSLNVVSVAALANPI